MLCPPSVFLRRCRRGPGGIAHRFRRGKNMHWGQSGAYTGELCGPMLVDAGCTHVILGHSERRQAGETDAQVNAKLHAALAARLIPIVCIGETKDQRSSDQTWSTCSCRS